MRTWLVPQYDQGLAHFATDLPWDGSAFAAVDLLNLDDTSSGLPTEEAVPIDGSEVRVVRATLVRLTVRTVDAETGRPIAVEGMTANFSRRPEHQTDDDGIATYMAKVGRERPFSGSLTFRQMSGWVAWDPTGFGVRRSAYAERLELVAPLRREVPVSVMVLNHKENPAPRRTSRTSTWPARRSGLRRRIRMRTATGTCAACPTTGVSG